MTQTELTGTRAYYYDRIRINTGLPVVELKAILKDELAKDGQHLIVGRPYKRARDIGFNSRIELFSPSVLLILNVAKKLDGIEYSIPYIEIARDTSCDSEHDAYFKTHNLFQTLRKKFSARFILYESNKKKKRFRPGKGLFSIETGYYGSLKFEYVAYARRSKLNYVPCVHEEWRMRGTELIQQKMSIKSLSDIAALDIKAFFETTSQRHLVTEEIDLIKLGRWVMGWNGKRREFTERDLFSIGVAAITFLRVGKLESFTPAELAYHIDRLKKKYRGRGRKSEWMKRVLELKGHGYFNKPYYPLGITMGNSPPTFPKHL
jgi:hypothetical protein